MTSNGRIRVAVYDAWLNTLGGGEKHILSFARALAREYSVDFYSHSDIDRTTIANTLGESTENIRFRYVPLLPDNQLSEIFAPYELFVNATHDSVLPNPCRRGLRLLFFPPRPLPRSAVMLNQITQPLRRATGLPEFEGGFYGPEKIGAGWYRCTGTQAYLSVPNSNGRTLTMMVGNAGQNPRGKSLTILANNKILHQTTIPPTSGHFRMIGPIELDATESDGLELSIQTDAEDPDRSAESLENRLLGLMISDPRTNTPFQSLVRIPLRRLATNMAIRLEQSRQISGGGALSSYQAVVANSDYTANWTQRWWNAPANTIYPPVAPVKITNEPKRPEILSVGRFFAGSHNKNHDRMVGWFRELMHQGLQGWTLRLIGTVGTQDADREYLKRVRRLAHGLPIDICTDIPASDLAQAYRQASLYWHSAGYGCHPNRHPERFEHFGISTVEAMSAGATPLVFAGGGLRETVSDRQSGYIWKTPKELKLLTWRLIRDARLRRHLAAKAVARSRKFSPTAFEEQIMTVAHKIVQQ